MRIIGGKDYYDQGLAFGHDDDVTYVRRGLKANVDYPPDDWVKVEPQALVEPPLRLAFQPVSSKGWKGVSYNGEFESPEGRVRVCPVVVWFCGTRHGGLRHTLRRNHASSGRYEETQMLWDLASFEAALAANGTRIYAARHDAVESRRRLVGHFDETRRADAATWLLENRVAIALHDASRPDFGWVLDADVLKSVEFSRRLAPYDAFQELSMYVGGILPREGAAVVEIVDQDVKVAKHGFDEWSFRRMPQASRR